MARGRVPHHWKDLYWSHDCSTGQCWETSGDGYSFCQANWDLYPDATLIMKGCACPWDYMFYHFDLDKFSPSSGLPVLKLYPPNLDLPIEGTFTYLDNGTFQYTYRRKYHPQAKCWYDDLKEEDPSDWLPYLRKDQQDRVTAFLHLQTGNKGTMKYLNDIMDLYDVIKADLKFGVSKVMAISAIF